MPASVTGAMNRYPFPVTVCIKAGFSGSSFRACRILRTAELMLLSVSKKTSLPQIFPMMSSRVTSCPLRSISRNRISMGIRSSFRARPERRRS